MTSTIVRTYTVGERPDDYAWNDDATTWCRDSHNGFLCTIRTGHEGPQHVGAHSAAVVEVWDRDTSGDVHEHEPYTLTLLDGRRVQVPAELYPTVRDEQHQYTVMLDDLRGQVEEARGARDRAQELYRTQQAEHDDAMEEFRQQVGRVAMRYARDNNWCSVVQRALSELGIEAVQRWRIRTGVKISHGDGWEAVRESVYVTVESSRDRGNVYQDVDDMGADDAINVLEQEGIEIPEGWQFESFDASTNDVELVDED